jgi:hypothetical protein
MGWPISPAATAVAAAVAACLAHFTRRYVQAHAGERPDRCLTTYRLPAPPLLPKEPHSGGCQSQARDITVLLLRLDACSQGPAMSSGQQAECEAAAQQALDALWSSHPAAPRVVGIDCEWQPERRAGEHNRCVVE